MCHGDISGRRALPTIAATKRAPTGATMKAARNPRPEPLAALIPTGGRSPVVSERAVSDFTAGISDVRMDQRCRKENNTCKVQVAK
mmetsp:Transcript_11137/g.16883  ORF Transcript_11137/g.16883 Transcript_11137/m.16883 type:complete len:86 (-) Transcript_11137:25-282(-)